MVHVSVYGAATETVTLTDAKGKAFSVETDAGGYGGVLEIPVGTYTIAGSYTNFSKTVAVDKLTTRVDAMPDGTIVYWYGYMPYAPEAISWVHSGESNNDKKPTITDNGTYLTVTQPGVSGTYCGTMKFDNVATNRGVPTLISSGKKVSDSLVRCYFTIAEDITKDQFPHIEAYKMDYQESNVQLGVVDAGTYDIAVEVRNNVWTPGEVDVYAIYFEPQEESPLRSEKQGIAIGNTYRYANSLIAGDWVKVSSLSFGSINYVGQGTEDYNAMMIPVQAFDYSGTFLKLQLALYLWTSYKSNHTFRWAVTTSTANAEAYKLGAGDVTDEYQLAAGSFTPPYSDAYQWHSFELAGCTVESGTPFYIYLWRDNTNYGNIHVMDSAVVTLEYEKD